MPVVTGATGPILQGWGKALSLGTLIHINRPIFMILMVSTEKNGFLKLVNNIFVFPNLVEKFFFM